MYDMRAVGKFFVYYFGLLIGAGLLFLTIRGWIG